MALYSIMIILAGMIPSVMWGSPPSDDQPRIAVKSNLINDVLLTPDIGIELSLPPNYSISLDCCGAWWSNRSKNHYWRIYGGTAELRYVLWEESRSRALTGHHFGVYTSLHTFDFEFGGKGWQSPDMTYGVGLSYGYSIPLNKRLNLDFGVKIGYAGGRLIKYKPQCGTYVCTSRSFKHHIGPTGVEITLVWFPGREDRNIPDYQ